jgi:quercetin dioxygenase-like cupin family protein
MLRVADGETITRQERREVVILAEHPALTITWSRYAGGERGPDLHVHREHTDAFYVLEGELTFAVGPQADRVAVGPGGFVAVPANVVHTFTNGGPAEARWLNLHAADCGFAAYLRAARDGADTPFDSFDPPADGGLPAAAVVLSGPGDGEPLPPGGLLKCARPELRVVEWKGEPPAEAGDEVAVRFTFAHREGAATRVVDARGT